MCPSFMATGEEEHTTRGRANALRLALSGTLPAEELTGERMFRTFDLCLQCKGCKAECPSNVDVAKMKAEFLSHYYREHGTPWSVQAMAHVARLNRWGSALAPLSNWLAQLPGAALLQEKILGVDRRRPLPRFERATFQKWFAAPPADAGRIADPIVLLDDCLTSYCEPNVNRAAVRVLERAGYEVHLAGLPCCGRAMISKGLLHEAQLLARANLERLRPWAERGVPIVGCEPSCLLTLVDEYPELVPGELARKVAEQYRLAGQIRQPRASSASRLRSPVRRADAGADPRSLPSKGPGRSGRHAGPQWSIRQVPGAEARGLIDSGCCGMAGSFGYEHYDLSMKIGERVLFPAVRAAPQASIIAPGFSCRHQIEHGTGRKAQHPIEFLDECLGG